MKAMFSAAASHDNHPYMDVEPLLLSAAVFFAENPSAAKRLIERAKSGEKFSMFCEMFEDVPLGAGVDGHMVRFQPRPYLEPQELEANMVAG